MKIGLFSDTFAPEVNGVASSTYMLRDELKRRGHQVYVFTTTSPEAKGLEIGTFRLPSMPLMVLPSRRLGMFYHPRLAEMIQTTGLDIVHTQTEFSLGIFGHMMANSLGVPHVHTYHTIYQDYTHYIARGLFDGQSKKMVEKYSRYYCNSCERVLTPSQKTKTLLQGYGVNRPIDIVPTGIDIAKFDRSKYDNADVLALKASLGIEPDAQILLNIGRISKEKNLQAVLRGLPRFFAKHPKARMLLVGGGPYISTLKEIALEEKIQDQVIFAGEQPWETIGMYYALGDVFISASTSETQGLTYVEAMSMGLPVVAKADPVIEGLVNHESTGLLFQEQDQIASALERAFFDLDLRDTLTNNAIVMAAQNSLHTFGERAEASYLAAQESKRSRTA